MDGQLGYIISANVFSTDEWKKLFSQMKYYKNLIKL